MFRISLNTMILVGAKSQVVEPVWGYFFIKIKLKISLYISFILNTAHNLLSELILFCMYGSGPVHVIYQGLRLDCF